MTIQILEKYKSLKPFTSEELSDFVIITGKNGTGKSQILQLIKQDAFERQNSRSSILIKIVPSPKTLYIEGISIENIQRVDLEKNIQRVNQFYQAYTSIHEYLRNFIEKLLSHGFNPSELQESYNLEYIVSLSYPLEEKNNVLNNIILKFQGHNGFTGNDESDFKKFAQIIKNYLLPLKRTLEASCIVCDYKNKSFASLERNDFSTTPIPEIFYTDNKPFSVQIENIFYAYARKRFVNETDFNRKINHGKENNAITDNEFIDQFPPPWIVINRILEQRGLKLRISEIPIEDFSPESDFEISLNDITSSDKIRFEELSSGEKIIVGLIIRLFLTDAYKNELSFPDLIVFDEPDAYLHPQMSSLLLEVLYETFVKELRIKVIITTHSPATVALAPEDCIYELSNGQTTELKKVSKDDALKILTDKLPLLSIDYKNHRQIFIESPTDEYYYQTLFNKLKEDGKTLFDLYFITTGYGKGNCQQVKDLTGHLRSAGNKTSFGIIDWDTTNSNQGFVFVHGFEKRYSIENFIFDPVYLMILFCEQNCSNNISEIGFSTIYNQYQLPSEPIMRIQEVIEWFFSKMANRFPAFKYENLIETKYANGKTLQLPSWFLKIQGHELKIKIREVFLSLNAFKDTGALEKRLTDIAGKCFPFIPQETFDLLIALSNPK